MRMRRWRLAGAILGLLGSGYGLYRIVELVFRGFMERDIWLLAGGGILLYLGGALLVVGFVVCAFITYLTLWE